MDKYQAINLLGKTLYTFRCYSSSADPVGWTACADKYEYKIIAAGEDKIFCGGSYFLTFLYEDFGKTWFLSDEARQLALEEGLARLELEHTLSADLEKTEQQVDKEKKCSENTNR